MRSGWSTFLRNDWYSRGRAHAWRIKGGSTCLVENLRSKSRKASAMLKETLKFLLCSNFCIFFLGRRTRRVSCSDVTIFYFLWNAVRSGWRFWRLEEVKEKKKNINGLLIYYQCLKLILVIDCVAENEDNRDDNSAKMAIFESDPIQWVSWMEIGYKWNFLFFVSFTFHYEHLQAIDNVSCFSKATLLW